MLRIIHVEKDSPEKIGLTRTMSDILSDRKRLEDMVVWEPCLSWRKTLRNQVRFLIGLQKDFSSEGKDSFGIMVRWTITA